REAMAANAEMLAMNARDARCPNIAGALRYAASRLRLGRTDAYSWLQFAVGLWARAESGSRMAARSDGNGCGSSD
ncbi:MAG: hypothetical protein JKY15_05550, partial [Deltaproteobacteria bacterium]|nr:hypothetical protein [Deltaproteobacteria bacterium]